MVQTVLLTMDIPQLLNTVADVPVVQVMQVHFPVVTQRPIPGHFLPQETSLDLLRITGRDLQEVARAKKATAGCLDGWAWNEIKALLLPWFSGLAILLELVESTGTWPRGLLDAYIAMIPKADGDSTPLGQRPLSVLPVVYRLWASLRLGHLREWVEGWLPKSVYSLGNGLSSVEAWFSTALDIEEVLSGTGDDQLHVMVADVIKSFDTVDRSILDCTLGRLGLPDWFRKVYFSFHSQVRLRFKLAAGLGEPWCRYGGNPQGCPLSMVFIVALYVPRCRHLESVLDVKPQLYADNLKCSAARPRALFESAHFTAKYVRLFGQDVSPGKCVLLSTSRAVRRAMKLWDISGDGGFGKVKLDVRDQGGHLDFTCRARAGTLSLCVGKATVGVAAVGALPFVFRLSWAWFVVSTFLLASTLLRLLMSLPLLSVLLGLPLFERFGPLRCFLLILLLFLIFLTGLLMLILLFMLFGLGFE